MQSQVEAFCFQELVQDIITECCFNYYKDFEVEKQPCAHCGEKCQNYVHKSGVDVYGQRIDNHDANGELVECPVCKKSVVAARFAPHLEKCMGMGRLARTKRSNSKTVETETNEMELDSNNPDGKSKSTYIYLFKMDH